MQKHVAKDVSELIEIKNKLGEEVSITENLDDTIQKKQAEITSKETELNTISEAIHNKRAKVIPQLKKQLEAILVDLGMPNAQFKMDVEFSDTFHTNGKDILSFLFSANKGGHFNELKKAASGGELSRIMLAIKSVLAKYIQLPTIMFDEIDTGVSGEISNKMGDIMLQMSQTMQVFSITHLPQIAAKGHSHFKVYKEDVNDRKGIIFGALDENSIAWKTAERVHAEGGTFVLTNAPVAMRMGQIDALAKKTGSQIIPADATSEEDLQNLVEKSMEILGGKIDFVLHSIGMSINVRKGKHYTDQNYAWTQKGTDVSAMSFHKVMQTLYKADAMNEWGSIVALTYMAAQRVFPDYNDMA